MGKQAQTEKNGSCSISSGSYLPGQAKQKWKPGAIDPNTSLTADAAQASLCSKLARWLLQLCHIISRIYVCLARILCNSFFRAHWFLLVHRLNVLKVRLYPPHFLLGTFQESPLSEHSVKPVHEVCLHSGTISGWHKSRSPTDETTNADICCQLPGGKLHLQHFWESTWTLPQRGILKTPHIRRVLALFLNLRIICSIAQNIQYTGMKLFFQGSLVDSTCNS